MTSIKLNDSNEFLNVRPELWSRRQVIDWINWCSSEYALHDIPINKFEMNGKALCMLTEDMFKQRVPNSGDILYRALKNLLPIQEQDKQQTQQVNSESTNTSNTSGAGDSSSCSNTNKLDLVNDKLICAKNTQQDIAQSNNSSSTSATFESTNSINSKKSKFFDKNFNSTKLDKIDKKMKPNLASDVTTATSLATSLMNATHPATGTSSLLLQKTTSKFMPLLTTKYNYDTNEMNNLDELDQDEENEIENDDDVEDMCKNESSKLTISSSSSSTSTPYSNLNTNSPNYERKRTANLENLIGNLKVRKLNQSTGSSKSTGGGSTNAKMTSLFVDVINGVSGSGGGSTGVGATSLSDCSPSTPPLSSPSVSPSSLSITSDSPMHASSSFSSSSSSLANQIEKLRYSLPKLRWLIESDANNTLSVANSNNSTNLNENQLKSIEAAVATAAQMGFDPIKLNEIMNESQQWCNTNTTTNNNIIKTSTTKAKNTNKSSNKEKVTNKSSASSNGSNKNQEDPTRQIKFYDDFIDFRGDVLRRPPDSKNCRILWEYLYLLLQNPNYTSVIRWEDETNMVFRIVQAEKLAALWGLQKNRLGMTYEKLSRGMRYYYPNNIIAREPGRRLLYRFMRHPDEIKKFVKKNGTYMLKRAKLGVNSTNNLSASSNNLDESLRTEMNPDDSGVDEPLNGSNINNGNKQSNKKTKTENKNHSKQKAMSNKKLNDNEDEYGDEDEEELDEELEEEIDEDEIDNSNINNTNNEDLLDQQSNYNNSLTSSPYSGLSQKTSSDDNKLNNNNGEMNKSNTQQHQQQQVAAALLAAAANAMNANRMYQDFYSTHDLLQYYAAAAANLQQQQQQTLPHQLASNYFSRSLKPTQSEDVNAAQLLMQLCNQNDNHYLNETIKNLSRNITNPTVSASTTTATNNNNNSNLTQTINNNKSKRASVARSNDLSSASSTSSNSSLEHSIDYETNDFSSNNNNNNINKNKNKLVKSEDLNVNYNEYPLNLSITNNTNNKKRKSKYDIQTNDL